MFFHIKSAENKLSLVERLISNIKEAERIKHWTPISRNIAGSIKFRNSLAHFEVFILTDENLKAIRPKTKFRYALSSHHLDYYAGRSGTVKVLSVESISHNSNELCTLTYQLIYFLVDHIPHLERLTASLEPRLLNWLDQFRKNPRPPGFEPPRKSSRPKQTSG